MAKTLRTVKFVSYLRVSTTKQGMSGLGMEAQREAVSVHLRSLGGELTREIVEVESDKQNERPQLAEALRLCRLHRATLIIAKLDRLARNVAFIANLMEAKVDFIAADNPAATKFTIHILAAVAEHEAEAISKRTKAALAAARARGTRLGGLRGTAERMQQIAGKGAAESAKARGVAAAAFRKDMMPVIDALQASGSMSLRRIAAALNAQGHRASRGGVWSASQVAALMTHVTVWEARQHASCLGTLAERVSPLRQPNIA